MDIIFKVPLFMLSGHMYRILLRKSVTNYSLTKN